MDPIDDGFGFSNLAAGWVFLEQMRQADEDNRRRQEEDYRRRQEEDFRRRQELLNQSSSSLSQPYSRGGIGLNIVGGNQYGPSALQFFDQLPNVPLANSLDPTQPNISSDKIDPSTIWDPFGIIEEARRAAKTSELPPLE